MLTVNDNAVLSQIFDLEAAPTSGILVDASLPADPVIQDAETLSKIKEKETAIIKDIEAAMRDTSSTSKRTETLNKAYIDIGTLLAEYPSYAALLNDHVQIFRLLHGDEILTSSSTVSATTTSLATNTLTELNEAIRILTPITPYAAISPAQCRTLAQSHTQRGALFHSASKTLSSLNTTIVVENLQSWTKLEFEEAASRDFFMGGRYGNEIGKQLAVRTNPTAKLCGKMVRDAMVREFTI